MDHFGVVLAYDIFSKSSWEEVTRSHLTVSHLLADEKDFVHVSILGLKADLQERGRCV